MCVVRDLDGLVMSQENLAGRLLSSSAASTIVEFGCGTGRHTEAILMAAVEGKKPIKKLWALDATPVTYISVTVLIIHRKVATISLCP